MNATTKTKVRKTTPHYIICDLCEGPRRIFFYRREIWEQHVIKRHTREQDRDE